jgi:hypothetical protein
MKETLFVCLGEGNSRSYAAIMETFQMTKLRGMLVVRSMPQMFRPNNAAPAACNLIENT